MTGSQSPHNLNKNSNTFVRVNVQNSSWRPPGPPGKRKTGSGNRIWRLLMTSVLCWQLLASLPNSVVCESSETGKFQSLDGIQNACKRNCCYNSKLIVLKYLPIRPPQNPTHIYHRDKTYPSLKCKECLFICFHWKNINHLCKIILLLRIRITGEGQEAEVQPCSHAATP